MEMTRNQLLNGLYTTKDIISEIIELRKRQVNIVAQYRQEQKMIEIKDEGFIHKSKIIITTLTVMVTLFYLVLSLITGNSSDFLGFIIFGAIVYWKRNKRSKLKVFALISLTFLVFFSLINMIDNILKGNILILILMIVLLIAASFLVRFGVKFNKYKAEQYNKQVEQHNREVEQHNQNVQNTFNNITQRINELIIQLQNQTSEWFPKKYYCMYAIDFFIDVIENYRADNVKEMVNLFENSEHQRRMEEAQDSINIKLNQSLINQNEINRSLKFANVLNTVQIALQSKTVNEIKKNTYAINENTYAAKSVNYNLNKIYSKIKNL